MRALWNTRPKGGAGAKGATAMKTKFGSPVRTQNLFDGGLYVLGYGGMSFAGLALCRAKMEYVVSLSPSPHCKTAPGLEPIEALHEAATSLSDLGFELYLSPCDVSLDPEAAVQPGEVIVIGEHTYLCYVGEDGDLGFVTFLTGQLQTALPSGPRNRYRSWQLYRQVAGQSEVLTSFPYAGANLTLLPQPEERRQEARPVSIERRRPPSKPETFGNRARPGAAATPPIVLAESGD